MGYRVRSGEFSSLVDIICQPDSYSKGRLVNKICYDIVHALRDHRFWQVVLENLLLTLAIVACCCIFAGLTMCATVVLLFAIDHPWAFLVILAIGVALLGSGYYRYKMEK